MKPREGRFRLQDFEVGSPLGQGAYGQVYKAVELGTGKEYVLKVLNKRTLIKMKKKHLPAVEKEALSRIQSPFVVHLYGTFKDATNLFFVIDFAKHGDLAMLISRVPQLSSAFVRTVLAQVLVAISDCHAVQVIHRDIKPENILLDEDNRVKLADFGTAKICNEVTLEEIRSSIVGTPEFVAPELLEDGTICYASDLWSFGCTIFNALTGESPFIGGNSAEVMHNIATLQYNPKLEELPADAKDLIRKLLDKNPSMRIGFDETASGYPSIRSHPFFNGIQWDRLKDIPMPSPTAPPEPPPPAYGAEFMESEETVILEGLAERKRFLSWKTRDLVLTSGPRLLVINIENRTLKVVIPISPMIEVKVSPNNREWMITWDKGKNQVFRCKDASGDVWVTTILRLALMSSN